MNELTQRGIAALKAGDQDAARQCLGAAIRQDPADVQAWIWLSGAVERDEERFDCLRQVLRLDPGNATAARGLAQLLERNPHLRPKVTGMLIEPPAASVPASARAEEENLLDRVALVPPPAPEPAPPQPRQETVQPAPAAAHPLPANARVISPIYPRRPKPSYSTTRSVFRTRPSLVPFILYFWLVIFILYGLLIALQSQLELTLLPVISLSAACGVLLVYIFIRTFTTRYELTTEHLALPFQGKKIQVPIPTILTVDTQQSGFQKILGTGDIVMDAGIDGVLNILRIRNIPQVKQRAEQILYMVRDQR